MARRFAWKAAAAANTTQRTSTQTGPQRAGKSGKATGTPGTIKLGQAKAISSRAIEKATGGPKKADACARTSKSSSMSNSRRMMMHWSEQ